MIAMTTVPTPPAAIPAVLRMAATAGRARWDSGGRVGPVRRARTAGLWSCAHPCPFRGRIKLVTQDEHQFVTARSARAKAERHAGNLARVAGARDAERTFK